MIGRTALPEASDEAKRQIARFIHRNESIHRHPVDGERCNYCDHMADLAVRWLVNHPELLASLYHACAAKRAEVEA